MTALPRGHHHAMEHDSNEGQRELFDSASSMGEMALASHE